MASFSPVTASAVGVASRVLCVSVSSFWRSLISALASLLAVLICLRSSACFTNSLAGLSSRNLTPVITRTILVFTRRFDFFLPRFFFTISSAIF